MNQAWVILAWNPTAIQKQEPISGHHRPLSTADCQHQNASASAIVIIASSELRPNIETSSGVVATAAAASSPAVEPFQRAAMTYAASTVTMPSSTCGNIVDHG